MQQFKAIKKSFHLPTLIEFSVLAISIWLIYPLIFSSTIPQTSAKSYFLRTIIGLLLLLILFGKTTTDLFFPTGLARQISMLKLCLLLIYSFLLGSSILYIAGKMIVIYFRQTQNEIFF